MSLRDYILSGRAKPVRGFDLYTEDGEVVVDEVYRFEDLPDVLGPLRDRLGLPAPMEMPHTKANTYRLNRDYREELDTECRGKITKVFAREIAHFGYEW